MNFHRFRAYAASEGTKSKTFLNRNTGDLDRRIVARWPTEEVAAEGEPDADGRATFDAGETTIVRVVFYLIHDENEVVCGSLDMEASGPISVNCPDPEIDEVEL